MWNDPLPWLKGDGGTWRLKGHLPRKGYTIQPKKIKRTGMKRREKESKGEQPTLHVWVDNCTLTPYIFIFPTRIRIKESLDGEEFVRAFKKRKTISSTSTNTNTTKPTSFCLRPTFTWKWQTFPKIHFNSFKICLFLVWLIYIRVATIHYLIFHPLYSCVHRGCLYACTLVCVHEIHVSAPYWSFLVYIINSTWMKLPRSFSFNDNPLYISSIALLELESTLAT